MRLSLDAPNIGRIEKRYVKKTLDEGYVSTFGPYVEKFESSFAGYLGLKDAIAVQSGTAALHLALKVLGVGEGDEVIIPSMTFVATINAVLYVGAKPVIVDIDEDTWNIDPELVKDNIGKNTKAIIPVHLYGNPCDMREIMGIASSKGICVIEDATESLGAFVCGRQTGTIGDIGCYSFNGNKLITTGNGGCVAARCEKLGKKIRYLVNQAKPYKGLKEYEDIGFNYRMTNLQAALGIGQMERVKKLLSIKRRINSIYRKGLKGIKSITFQDETQNAESSWWMSCIRLKNKRQRDKFIEDMKGRKIPFRKVFKPLDKVKLYAEFAKRPAKIARKVYDTAVVLPSSTLNKISDIEKLTKVLRSLI